MRRRRRCVQSSYSHLVAIVVSLSGGLTVDRRRLVETIEQRPGDCLDHLRVDGVAQGLISIEVAFGQFDVAQALELRALVSRHVATTAGELGAEDGHLCLCERDEARSLLWDV